MNQVFQKTRELGEALKQSEEYAAMKQLEQRATQNPQAAFTMGKYLEAKNQVEELLVTQSPDTELLRKISDEMDAYQEQLQTIDDIVNLTQARQNFSNLIEQVNQVLRFIVTGEMAQEDDEGSGCGGSCHTCGGCGHNRLH